MSENSADSNIFLNKALDIHNPHHEIYNFILYLNATNPRIFRLISYVVYKHIT